MIPRRDPETLPVLAGIQLIKRSSTDDYGVERARKYPVYRPFQTRNGLPVRPYLYGGTGESMSHREAEWWLCGTVSEEAP